MRAKACGVACQHLLAAHGSLVPFDVFASSQIMLALAKHHPGVAGRLSMFSKHSNVDTILFQ